MIRQAEMTLNGLHTVVREHGPADAAGDRTLMCLHPIGQDASFHDGLAQALGDDWRVVSHDQRGHGAASPQPAQSLMQMVNDAEALLGYVGSPVHLAGFSMGGSVAAELAGRRAPDIITVTLAATPARGLPVFSERACAVAQGSVAAVSEPTLERWFGQCHGSAVIDVARASLEKMTADGYDAVWHALASFRGYEPIAASLPPALCLSFTDDLSTPPPVLDEIARIIRNSGGTAARRNIPAAGHMGLLQVPQAVASALLCFVNESGAN